MAELVSSSPCLRTLNTSFWSFALLAFRASLSGPPYPVFVSELSSCSFERSVAGSKSILPALSALVTAEGESSPAAYTKPWLVRTLRSLWPSSTWLGLGSKRQPGSGTSADEKGIKSSIGT
eukprot:scaffold272635_cov43-Prasinocladus_malaysianus.AAC.1